MACKVCKLLAKWILSTIVSLGMFMAMMAFHIISFVALLLLSIGIVFGISLTFSYFAKRDLPVCVENIFILMILSLLSKFHVIFYYKLIYPGDNYERACWGFLKIVTKVIYAALASLAFMKILQIYLSKCRNESSNVDSLEELDIGPAKILLSMWHNGNKYFLVSMAILIHLFSLSIYNDYTSLCKFVPFFSCPSLVAISLTLVGQSISFMLALGGMYLVNAWIPPRWKTGDNENLYIGLTQLSVFSWVLQSTILEILMEKCFSLADKDQAPYYWLQNTNRGRILLLKFVLLPLLVHLFYSNCTEDWITLAVPPHIIPNSSSSTLFFPSFISCVMIHAAKSLMLLKNGIARLIYRFWMCYFHLQQFMYCCCDDEDDWLTDSTSGTAVVSDVVEDEAKISGSKASHGNKKWRFWPESKKAREHFAEGTRRDNESEENVVKGQNFVPPALRNGVGDSGWAPVMTNSTESTSLDLEMKTNVKDQLLYRTRSTPAEFCSRNEQEIQVS